MLTALLALCLTDFSHAAKKSTAPAAPPPATTAAPAASAGVDPTLAADIRTLLELTNAKGMAMQMIDQLIPSMAAANPAVPASFWTDFRAQVDPGQLLDLEIPIYARHFTDEDIKGLIAFYQSPIGAKMLAVQPALMADSMQAGQAYGQLIGQQVVEALQKQGAAPTK